MRLKGASGRGENAYKSLWLLVDPFDKFQFPIAICSTAQELANRAGVTVYAVIKAIKLVERGEQAFSKYVRVDYTKDEWEEFE